MQSNDEIRPRLKGHIKVYDLTDPKKKTLMFERDNAVHQENMSLSLAEGIARTNVTGVFVGPIQSMVFGNGGTSVNGIGNITYLAPNTVGENATLYNQTYSKIVDQNNPLNVNTSRNYLNVAHVSGNLFSDVVVICTLEFGEPSAQQLLDTTATLNDNFVFDELGLINYDNQLLCHVLFAPTQKSANRVIQVQYSMRIALI